VTRALWPFVAIAAVAAVAVPAGQQTPRFVSRRDVIRVDALVTDHGKPVTGLTPQDFEVRDNGVLQTIDLALADETPINAILALDLSESVAGDRLQQLRQANRSIVDVLKPDDRAALIGFSHAVRLHAPLGLDRSGLLSALNQPGGEGGTALFDAAYTGVVLGPTDAGRSLVIIFSDGVDTSSWLTSDAVHDAAERAGTVVYAVATAGAKTTFLKDLATETGGSVIEIQSTKDLGAVFLRVLEEFRHRYLLSYSPKDVTPGGWHRLEVRVRNRNGLTIKARPGYLTGTRETAYPPPT
jgi:Ca-activated chloride channel family protein